MSIIIYPKVPENVITREKLPEGACARLVVVALFDWDGELDAWGLEFGKDYEYSYTEEQLAKTKELFKFLLNYGEPEAYCDSCNAKRLQEEMQSDIIRQRTQTVVSNSTNDKPLL